MSVTVESAVHAQEIRTPWTEFWRKFRQQHIAMIAAVFVLLLIVIAIISPYIAPYDAENYFDYDALNAGPSAAHWFGGDSRGGDIPSRILVGSRISLSAGLLSVVLGAVIGTFFVLLAG